jgi:hypothetical protein
MSDTQLPALKPYHPTTFEERGVAVPFTTPLLGGTRARPTVEQKVELVVPNPSGGRGVYVMPWTGITSWCRPTLHDTVFNERIAVLHNVTPATIRRVGFEVAAEGLAGEEAMEAARLASNAEKGDRLVTNYRLLMTLVEQVGKRFPSSSLVSGPDKVDLMTQARLTVDWISPRLGQPATWTAGALEALSDVMANIGPGSAGATGRLPRLLTMLRQACSDMSEWSCIQQDEDQAEYVNMVGAVAEVTLSIAQTTLEKAQALTGDMVALLRTWAADPKAVTHLVMRPEWLLDGWAQICLIWNHARDDAERRAALIEIAGLLPILPKEASEWSGVQSDFDKARRFRRLVSLNEDWRTGSMVFELIARNEHFRAITCST